MSRSIHMTRAALRRLRARAAGTADGDRESVKRAEAALRRKRRIKSAVARERHPERSAGAPTRADSVEIEVRDTGPWVHHAISVEDVRTILAALPAAATEGVARVRLGLGFDENEKHARKRPGIRDPHTGRIGSRLIPGVDSGNVLGAFLPSRGQIEVYAYVVDSRALVLPRPLCDFYLRLHALKTLLHEVAHHHDHVARVRRGRWLADRMENCEWYAEMMEHHWTAEVLEPYVTFRYRKEWHALRAWVRHRGGIAPALEFFGGDNRRTSRDGGRWLIPCTSASFEWWLDEVPTLPSLIASRLAFAWQLHFSDRYDDCLAVLDRVLRDHPSEGPAHACRADTLVHLERHDEALQAAMKAIELDPADDVAWQARADVAEHRRDWRDLLVICDQWQAHTRKPRGDGRDLHHSRAIAWCALGDTDAMERCFAEFLATVRFRSEDAAKRRAAILRRSTYRRAGKTPPPDPFLDARRKKP